MADMIHAFGPVPSRRLGRSLGVSPIPQKYCNHSCIYCQLGRTDHLVMERMMFYPVEEILADVQGAIEECGEDFDVVTIVGEGEPTLYSGLGQLIDGLKRLTVKPIAVITNGALLSDPSVRRELGEADIVMPSLDAVDEAQYASIDRPHGKLNHVDFLQGLETFSHEFEGQLWLEIMLVKGYNDDEKSLGLFKEIISHLKLDRLYINVPVRPPAETGVNVPDADTIERAVGLLGGIAMDHLASVGFHSQIVDDLEAILSIIMRHPMNQFEIKSFLEQRRCKDIDGIFDDLLRDPNLVQVFYKGYVTYRYRT